ncbi:hypothetical protein Hanom_Chr15g01341011 [Helianthus anomalus]
MGIQVLSGVHFLEVLAYLLLVCNEDTGPVTPALIFRGVTTYPFDSFRTSFYSNYKIQIPVKSIFKIYLMRQ